MALRAWQVWGMSAALAGGLVAVAQSPRSPVSGRATPAITQDHYQPDSAPPPRVLPQQVLAPDPSKTAPPTAVNDPLVGRAAAAEEVGGPRWKARVALDVADMHDRACEPAEARRWYQEVIKLAPRSEYAAVAAERLNRSKVVPAGGESSEPPLADARAGEAQTRIPNR